MNETGNVSALAVLPFESVYECVCVCVIVCMSVCICVSGEDSFFSLNLYSVYAT